MAFDEDALALRDNQLLQPVLIIDQVEELFTLISDESRKTFVNQLADLVRAHPSTECRLPGWRRRRCADRPTAGGEGAPVDP